MLFSLIFLLNRDNSSKDKLLKINFVNYFILDYN
jgi:hypothetical protein